MQKIYRNFQDFSLFSCAFAWVNKTTTPVPSHGFISVPVSGGSVVTVGCEEVLPLASSATTHTRHHGWYGMPGWLVLVL